MVRRGYPLMRAHFPRCYVDVNREPYELDPRMFEGRLPSFANTRSMRVAGGLGTVARVVGDAQEIYRQRIPIDDAIRRIEGLYKPYHRALRRLFTRLHRDFGAAVLIDCHSMPSTAGSKDERPRADVVLGDRYGTSCVAAVVGDDRTRRCARRAIRSAATSPMPAGSSPSTTAIRPPGCMPIQLELNRALYMDERRYERSPSFRRRGRRPRDCWRIASPPSRWRSCGRTGRRRNSRAGHGSRQGGSRASHSGRGGGGCPVGDDRRICPVRQSVTPSSLVTQPIGIGESLAAPPLPHHRTYGSVYGGSAD